MTKNKAIRDVTQRIISIFAKSRKRVRYSSFASVLTTIAGVLLTTGSRFANKISCNPDLVDVSVDCANKIFNPKVILEKSFIQKIYSGVGNYFFYVGAIMTFLGVIFGIRGLVVDGMRTKRELGELNSST